MEVSDTVITVADTRHTQRWSEREINLTLCKGYSVFLCNCPKKLGNFHLWAHERSLGIPRNVDDLETVEFADVLRSLKSNI